jgi:nicotinamidase-related amidase
MAKSRNDLYGNAPDQSPVALLLIDVINDLDFPEAESLLRHALPMAKRLAALKLRAAKHGCAAIYVNDNFGRWRSDFKTQVQHCLADSAAGRPLAELLRPSPHDYFVLKPAHSGFYSTVLEVLLEHLETKTLIITGLATNICVHFTANDAYLRGYRIVVPSDCVAANTAALSHAALDQMRLTLKASIQKSTSLNWKRLRESKGAK